MGLPSPEEMRIEIERMAKPSSRETELPVPPRDRTEVSAKINLWAIVHDYALGFLVAHFAQIALD